VNVSYIAPLRRAWDRARGMLLRPFRIETWLVLGFAAFLSEFLSGGGHYPGPGFRRGAKSGLGTDWLSDFTWTPVVVGIVVAAAMVLLAIMVALIWVNSRGKFVFLDGVARERAEIVAPWKRFARLGNSLFAWTVVFALVSIAIGLIIAFPFVAGIIALFQGDEFRWAGLGALMGLFLMGIPILIVYLYIGLFLSDFVVPIMYRHDLAATAAWGRFLTVFRAHPGSFILYGLWVFVLWTVTLSACFFAGIVTCCVGFVLLGLPYIGSVLLLPVHVTARGLGPEFLAQFGPDLAVFPDAAAPPPGAAGPEAPGPAPTVPA